MVELFEARKPKDPAVISEISGKMQPSDDELELDREMEYLVEPDETEVRGITGVE